MRTFKASHWNATPKAVSQTHKIICSRGNENLDDLRYLKVNTCVFIETGPMTSGWPFDVFSIYEELRSIWMKQNWNDLIYWGLVISDWKKNRRQFQSQFYQWTLTESLQCLIKKYLYNGPWLYVTIEVQNGLVPIRLHAIFCTNVGHCRRRIYALLGINGLKHLSSAC